MQTNQMMEPDQTEIAAIVAFVETGDRPYLVTLFRTLNEYQPEALLLIHRKGRLSEFRASCDRMISQMFSEAMSKMMAVNPAPKTTDSTALRQHFEMLRVEMEHQVMAQVLEMSVEELEANSLVAPEIAEI